MTRKQLMSVKEASSKTGITEEIIRKHIRSGRIGGEKKNYLLWDEWFMPEQDLGKLKELARAKGQETGSKSQAVADPDSNTSGQLEAEIDRAFSPNTFAEAFGPAAADIVLAANTRSPGAVEPTGQSPAGAMEISEALHDASMDGPRASGSGATTLRETIAAPESRSELFELNERQVLALVEPQGRGDDALSDQAPGQSQAWSDYRSKAKTVAEEFLAPLLHRLEVQSNMLREKDLIIEQQAAQLRLLPDFQRQTEESQKIAEDKEREALQLRQNLTWERKKALIKISAWQIKHVRIEQKIHETESLLAQAQDRRESEINYLHCQLTQLQGQLAEMQKPWWKKLFKA